MIGISYHPLYDPYHCLFRLSAILQFQPDINVDLSRIKLIDFYILLPSLIKKIRLSGDFASLRADKGLKKTQEPYQKIPSSRSLFRTLEPIQDVAIRHKIGVGLISSESYTNGKFARNPKISLPSDFLDQLQSYISNNICVFEFMIQDLEKIPTFGVDGMKHRTDLMEYKYDVV